MNKKIVWLVVLIATTLIVGCQAGESPLVGTEWVLTSMEGEAPLADTEITLKFEEKWMSGSAGCNGYGGGPDSGKYSATKSGKLEIPVFAITVRECHSPEGVMEQEKAYVEAMRSSATYRIAGDNLEIRNAEGETILVYARKP
jgi:heat shock protein HslJ